MSNRPSNQPRQIRHAMAVRLDRALNLLDRIVTMIEAGVPHAAEPSNWDGLKSRVKGWNDPEVRLAIIASYGRSSTRETHSLLAAEFGTRRAPSKSALARLFIQMARHELTAAS